MEESFIINVQHKGEDLHLETALVRMGYIHKFRVMVEGTAIFFEPDEEGRYRAVLEDVFDEKAKRTIDTSLVQAIAETINSI
jgi:hypothetical protein